MLMVYVLCCLQVEERKSGLPEHTTQVLWQLAVACQWLIAMQYVRL